MTSEGNRVVVRARWNGYLEGELNGILPTHRKVEMPFGISYEIENDKIAQHWLIQDHLLQLKFNDRNILNYDV
jgi:predicted ester cyclase